MMSDSDLSSADQEEKVFEQRISTIPPVLVLTHLRSHDPIFDIIYGCYSGIVSEVNDFSPNHPDWKVRRLYQYGIVEKKPIKIIIPVREPVSENVHNYLFDLNPEQDPESLPSIKKCDLIKNEFLRTFHHEKVLHWFETSIHPVLGIDVFAAPFPDSGWEIIANDNVKILVIRQNQQLLDFQSIRDFLEISNEMDMGNSPSRAHESVIPELRISSYVVLPYNYIQKLCDSKYFTHFFSPETKEQVIRKWCDFDHSFPSEALKNSVIHMNLPLPNIIRHDLNLFRFWYVDIPRTSSSSVKVELGKKFGIAYGKQNLIEKEQAQFNVISNHIPAKVLRKQVGHQLWNSMFKFSLVRNPWDRLVSIYNYRRKINSIPLEMSYSEYITELERSRGYGLFKYHGFYCGNADYILDDYNTLLVDYVGKFESRQQDLCIIAAQIGLPELGQIHLQAGKVDSQHYSQYYDDNTRKKVGEIYSRDIEFFNYTFEDCND